MEQANFKYSPLGKSKTIEEQEKKQVEALSNLKSEKNKEINQSKNLFPKWMRSNEIKNDLDKIKKWEEQIRPKDLVYKTNQNKYDSQLYETIRSFGDKNQYR